MKMNRLCLSTALLFLLVILVDSTPLNIHHVQDEGLETSHRRGPEKRSTKNTIKSIIRGVSTGAKIASAGSGLINEVIKAIRKGNKGHVIVSGAKYKNHTAEESPTLNIQQLILSEKNKADSRPAFCLEPKVVGHGKASMPRYFYNAKTGHCELFTYSGLGRNENNFLTLEDCIKTCGQGAGSLW
ncbi:trophoblast Kunitz domain protein 1-like [Budorcas taxicolor]|uniref:trophoblast Kunitz domain protein 1-like n=1 Tax=Budorcas taxicolor TaxID=37181 RepID=UPI002284AFAC|nr:trophoblast Kunitz domain protein 1-like [Budorcas taxicolor]